MFSLQLRVGRSDNANLAWLYLEGGLVLVLNEGITPTKGLIIGYISWVITLLIGVLTPLITSGGPPCK